MLHAVRGMHVRARVAMGRMLANDPDVILADEPTASLDPVLTENLMNTLQELNQQGKTIVLVTHSKDHAAMATRRLVLRDGKIGEALSIDSYSG